SASPPGSPGASPSATEPSQPPGNSSPTPGPPPGSPPASTGPGKPGVPAVTVNAGNAVLTTGYWAGRNTAAVRVTATNVGSVPAQVTFRYALPPGVPYASCPGGCALQLAPRQVRSLDITLRVAPDAWQQAPLSGGLTFVALAPGAAPQTGQVTWGIVFPPGPPTPGLKLVTSDVHLPRQASTPGTLTVQLTDTGQVPGSAAITVIAPTGASLGTLPAGCRVQKARPATAVCTNPEVAAGTAWTVQLPLSVPAKARADAPLVGLVRAQLQPAGQQVLQTQASYQVFAPGGQAGVTIGASASASAPSPSVPGGGGGVGMRDRVAGFPLVRSPIAWPIIGGSATLLVVALIGILLTLRRRREEARVWAPVRIPAQPAAADEPEPDPASVDKTAVISAGPVDRTPTPRGPISWEWIPGSEPDAAREPSGTASGDGDSDGNTTEGHDTADPPGEAEPAPAGA
ncbi:MAG TPA: hypothetical protein VJT31_07890, partial [Rugosimonospora sp.]|nr:hypothetical protein [Rugosimonospora sp.]